MSLIASDLKSVKGSTLVICPLSVIGNWETQISQHFVAGAVSSYVYHGPQRKSSKAFLSKYDIVLTTFGTALSDFAKPTKNGVYGIKWHRIVLE